MRKPIVLLCASFVVSELAFGKVLTIHVTPSSHRDKFRVATTVADETVHFRITSLLPGPPKSQARVLIEGQEQETRDTAIKTSKDADSVIYEFELQGRLVAHAVFYISRQEYYPTGQPAPSGDVYRFKLSDFVGPRFELYLVKKRHGDLEKTELEAEPLLTEKDIVSYDWATHTMELTEEGTKGLPPAREMRTVGKSFVVVADGQRCYRGAFWTPLSSISHPNPVILVTPLPARTVRIERAYPSAKSAKGEDPRSDARLLKVLRETGKLQRPEQGARAPLQIQLSSDTASPAVGKPFSLVIKVKNVGHEAVRFVKPRSQTMVVWPGWGGWRIGIEGPGGEFGFIHAPAKAMPPADEHTTQLKPPATIVTEVPMGRAVWMGKKGGVVRPPYQRLVDTPGDYVVTVSYDLQEEQMTGIAFDDLYVGPVKSQPLRISIAADVDKRAKKTLTSEMRVDLTKGDIQFTLRNSSAASVVVVKPDYNIREFNHVLEIEVTGPDGERYLIPHSEAATVPPNERDYAELKPGEALTAKVPIKWFPKLREALERRAPGRYTVRAAYTPESAGSKIRNDCWRGTVSATTYLDVKGGKQ